MAFVLILVYMLPLFSYAIPGPAFELQENNTLYLLTLAPFPDERYNPGFAGSPAIIPAVRLAVEHINNRADILDGYTLKQFEADSGCANSVNAVINFVRYVYHSGRRIVGIVGPACSGPTERVGLFSAQSEVSILQVSTATSPELTDEKYSNTFRAVSSALVYIDVFVRLMERNGWDHVATLYQDSRRYFSATHAKFVEVDMKNHIGFSSPIFERYIPLEQLRASRTRIVFVFAGGNLARKLMCLAYHFDFIYPKYQWVFHDRPHSQFINANVSMVYNSKQYTCNETEMTKAISGAILNIYRLTRTDRTTNDTAAQRSYNEYEVEYNQTRKRHLEELADRNVSVDSSDTESQYSNVYYDAVWALALALNKSIPMLESFSYDLSNYAYGQENITNVVWDQLISLSFEGMSGKISFSDTTRESNSIIDVYQVFNGSSEPIGVYENNMLPRLNGSFISDSFRVVVDAIPEELGIFVLSVIIPPVAAATILLHVANLLYCNHRSMKATSPTLNHLAFSGCYLFIVGAIFFTIQETWGFSDPSSYHTLLPIQCSIFMWSTTMGYSLIFGSLCVKMWRLSRIYTNFRRYDTGRDGLIMSDYSLIGITLLVWLLDVGINLTWNLVDPWMVVIVETTDGVGTVTVLVYCDSHYLPYWVATIVTYISLLSLVVVYFSIRTRNIPKKDFKYSKHINKLVFMLVLLFSVGIPIYIFCLWSSAIVAAFVIMVVILLTTVVLCLLFLFLPSVIPLLKCSSCCRT